MTRKFRFGDRIIDLDRMSGAHRDADTVHVFLAGLDSTDNQHFRFSGGEGKAVWELLCDHSIVRPTGGDATAPAR